MFEKAEFPQKLRLLRFNLLGLEDRGAAWSRVDERKLPTLLTKDESGGGTRKARSDYDDFSRARLKARQLSFPSEKSRRNSPTVTPLNIFAAALKTRARSS